MKWFQTSANFAIPKQVNKILDCLNFVCKEISLNKLNLLCFAYYYRRQFPVQPLACFLMTTGKPVYTKLSFVQNFALYVTKQVIVSAVGQLRINCTCIFKVFQIALVTSRLGPNFVKTLKILVKLILTPVS